MNVNNPFIFWFFRSIEFALISIYHLIIIDRFVPEFYPAKYSYLLFWTLIFLAIISYFFKKKKYANILLVATFFVPFISNKYALSYFVSIVGVNICVTISLVLNYVLAKFRFSLFILKFHCYNCEISLARAFSAMPFLLLYYYKIRFMFDAGGIIDGFVITCYLIVSFSSDLMRPPKESGLFRWLY